MGELDENYSYASLLHEGQIRLFKLHISQDDEPLMGSMVAVLPDQIPPYIALSYTWGTPYAPEELRRLDLSSQRCHAYSIICDWRVLPVTENLYYALVELRSRGETEFLWIDAICINQKDDDEKSLQVQLMASIYSNAEMVIVWLGKGTPECDEAIKLLVAASEIEEKETQGAKALIASYMGDQWGLIKTFCSRQWFTRTWTLQEAILAKRIVGLCGSTQFNFHQVIKFPCFIANLNRVMNLDNLISEGSETCFRCVEMIQQWQLIWSSRGLYRNALNPIGTFSRRLSLSVHGFSARKHSFALLELLVSDMRQREVSDPKDRILAPMAVFLNSVYMPDTKARETFKKLINYRHDVALLYQTYTFTSIMLEENLDVLSQVGGKPSMPPLNLSSWAPDFRSKPMPSLLESTSFNASNGLGEFDALLCPIRGRSQDPQTVHLKLRGVLLGRVLFIDESRRLPTTRLFFLLKNYVMSRPQYKNQDYLEVISRTLAADIYLGKCPASNSVESSFMAFVMCEKAMELKIYRSHTKHKSLTAFWETQVEFLDFWEDETRRQKLAKLKGNGAPTPFREQIEELSQMSAEKASSAHERRSSWTHNIWLGWRLLIDAFSATEKFLFVTNSGYIGLAPQGSKVGDAVWIVQGGKVPFILRPTGTESARFVGEAYVHGRMFGEIAEVAKAQNLPMQDILIDE